MIRQTLPVLSTRNRNKCIAHYLQLMLRCFDILEHQCKKNTTSEANTFTFYHCWLIWFINYLKERTWGLWQEALLWNLWPGHWCCWRIPHQMCSQQLTRLPESPACCRPGMEMHRWDWNTCQRLMIRLQMDISWLKHSVRSFVKKHWVKAQKCLSISTFLWLHVQIYSYALISSTIAEPPIQSTLIAATISHHSTCSTGSSNQKEKEIHWIINTLAADYPSKLKLRP